ncbi:MAG: sel1 repeat family protein [Gammaproteobacteria bacterium]|nr:sel1 repeat family protein [Gammaproteobacteria bacterium]MCG3146527.1 Secretory immunoglobulin A-binding protein EsiB [Gammaproteobacteria bacterium]
MHRLCAVLLVILSTLARPAPALEFKDGLDAYRRQDWSTAIKVFTLLAERGDARSQFALAMMHDRGEGLANDDRKALEWYTKSAEGGYAKAQLNLGFMYERGEGVAKDAEQSLHWFREAATQGNPEALARLTERAGSGDPDAQFVVGSMHGTGRGVEKNVEAARKWLGKAAKAGHVKSQYNLAVLLEEAGEEDQARQWYKKAAAQGHAKAAYNLGLLYLQEEPAAAVRYLEEAAKQGHAAAQFQLALLFDEGRGVSADHGKARKLFESAARAGYAPAQVNLGSRYARGENAGAPPDLVRAYAWFTIAARSEEAARKNLKLIESRLQPGQIDAARALLPRLLDGSAVAEDS